MYLNNAEYPVENTTDKDLTSSAALALSLSRAIDNDELCVHYQPRYDVAAGQVKIFEALVRWQKPDVGLVYPVEFIDLAIQHGLIFALDLWVFEQCCKDLLCLRKHYDGEIKIAVNITAIECESLHHTQKLLSVCEEYGLRMEDFEFEITESVYIRDARKVEAFCHTFTGKGASISLDDFGTGQSPLTSLCNLPIDTIKIDRSFVRNMEGQSRIKILINHLIAIANEMQLKVVAEGIEDAALFKKMTQLGCHQLQGFQISQPLTARMLVPYLHTV